MKDIIFTMALRNIKINYLRSILAALGITIGIISIASMGMLGTNMTASVKDSLSSMADKLQVSPYSGKGGGGGPPGGSSTTDNLTKAQYKDIVKIANQYGYAYGVHSIRAKAKKGKDDWSTTVYGLETSVMKTVLENLSAGGYPSSDNSVLIGQTFADDNGFEVGSKFSISDQGVKVAGIIATRGMSMDLSTDSAVIMTKGKYESMFGATDEYNQVNIVLNNIDDSSAAVEAITKQMNRREEVIRVQDSSRMVSMISSSVTTITSFASLIAGISLLVASISIFNIMMMSVTERIREIGVLRSIGTQKKEILRMFIYEATLIGFIGAFAGMVFTLIIGYMFILIMVGNTKYFFTYDSLIHLPYAMLIGLVICILSGAYPAWRGANLDPIEALRAD
jgi:putative ABC transport system permease protein